MARRPNQHSIVVVLFLLTYVHFSNQTQLFISLEKTTINQYSAYDFVITDTGAFSQTGTIILTFQTPPYTFSNNTNITACRQTNTGYVLNCYVSATNKISFAWTTTVINQLNLGDNALMMSITLLNPPYVDNFTISYDFILSNTQPYSTTSNLIKGLTADALTSCAVSFSPSTTYSLSSSTIQMQVKNSIPAGGSLQITINGYSLSSNTLTSINTLSNSSVLSTTLPTYNSQVYIFSSFFKSAISSGSVISFSLSTIMTPPTTQTNYYDFSITTLYTSKYFNQIDNKICYLSVSDTTASLTITISSTFYVGQTKSPTLTFLTPTGLAFTTDTFNFIVDSGSTSYLSIAASLSNGVGIITGLSSTIRISNITNGVNYPTNTLTDTVSSDSNVSLVSGITLKSMVNSGLKTVFFQIFRSGYSFASVSTSILIKPNSLMSASIGLLSSIVSKSTTYNFTVLIKNPLTTGAAMRITLPSQLYIANGSCSVLVTSSLGGSVGSPSCTATSNSIIFVTNLLTSLIPTNTSLTVAVSNILNPISTKTTTTSVFLQTFYSSSELVNSVDDSSTLTGLTITAIPGPIAVGDFLISRSNVQNLQFAIYTIYYKVNSKFKANGFMTLSFPSSMILSSSISASYILTYLNNTNSTSTTLAPTSIVSGTNTIITLNFSNLVTSDISAGNIFTININSIKNYKSFKTIYPQLTSYTNDGYGIEQSGLTDFPLTNTIQDTSLIVASTTTIRINGQPTNVSFQITPTSSLNVGDIITVQLQNTNNVNTQMYFSTNTTCVVNNIVSACSLNISNSKVLSITLASALSISTLYTFYIGNVIYSRSFDQPGKIYFTTYETSTAFNISYCTVTPSINTQTNSIKSVVLSIDDNQGTAPSQLNQVQKFTLTITPYNNLQSGDILVVTVPPEYLFVQSIVSVITTDNLTTKGGSLCSNTNLFCSNNNSNGNLIRIVQRSAGTVFTNISTLSIIINNDTYRSPQLWTTYNSNPFVVNTYSSTGNVVDSVQSGTTTNATFYLACPNSSVYHCMTCLATGICTACFKVGDGYNTSFNYGGYFYKQSTGQCVTACGLNYYNSSNNCIQCTSPCYSCSSTGTFCNSCVNTTVNGTGPYYLYNNTCLPSCPSSYYKDTSSFMCVLCNANCLTCLGSATLCTSCKNNSYLSTTTLSCVDSTGCELYQYPDSSTWKCTNCSVSCSSNGCTPNATWCKTCATGYIRDVAYGSIVPGPCTNICPTGTANDTNNSLGFGVGCRCNGSACLTCQTTINTCLSCKSGYLLNSNCISSCGSGYYISNSTVCSSCSSNCLTCSSSSLCYVCSSTQKLYEGQCLSSCPTDTTAGYSNGTNICIFCGSGCTTCLDSLRCSVCSTNMLPESNSTNRYCVFSCSSTQLNVNNQYCATQCPATMVQSGSYCINSNNTNTNTNTAVTASLTSNSKIIPFPVTIALAVLCITTLTSKVALPFTVVPAALCAFGGLMQILSWLIFMISQGTNSSSSYPLSQSGLYVVLIAFLLNLLLNVLGMYFFKKYVWPDDKFQTNFNRLKNKTKVGVCITYTCFGTTLLISHKFVEIMFSNIFQSQYFVYKIEDKSKLTPLNYVRYLSFLPSILAIVGASMANFEYQVLSMNSIVYIQSIDLIVVTLVSGILSFWVTTRKQDDYQKNIAEKKQEMSDKNDQDPLGQNIYHLEEEQKQGNKLKKYSYKSSIINNVDLREDPLGRKRSNRIGPMGEQTNLTNVPLGDKQDGQNRINLQIRDSKRLTEGLDLDSIYLQESGDNMIPNKVRKGGKGTISDRHNRQKNNKNAINQDPQKQKIKDSISNKLTQNEIQKTKVIREVSSINVNSLKDSQQIDGSENSLREKSSNDLKKQQLQTLDKSSPSKLSKLSERERQKVGQIKTAMNILKVKKVQIGQYLEYLDIIQEQDQDKRSDEYQNKHFSPKSKGTLGKSKGKNGKNVVSSKKMQKRDRTARKNMADDLVIVGGHNLYDQQLEPQIPNFHQSPTRARNHSQTNIDASESDEFIRLSNMKKNQNKSDQMFIKNKQPFDNLVLVSLESGQNYQRSMGEQFQRGNTLQQVEKDQLPPSNLYSTEQMLVENKKSLNSSVPIGKDRIIPNTLINDDDNIEYIESQGGDQETIKGELVDFNNDISPSHFNEPNLRMENDELSEAPTKPRIVKKKQQQKLFQDRVLQIQDMEDNYDQFDHEYDNNMPNPRMNRYQSNQGMLDYDDILYQRRNNQKMKELQKIYLPRIDVPKHNKKNRKNYSSQSYRKQQQK